MKSCEEEYEQKHYLNSCQKYSNNKITLVFSLILLFFSLKPNFKYLTQTLQFNVILRLRRLFKQSKSAL